MALSRQSEASTRASRRPSADSTPENVDSPSFHTRSKKLRSSGNVFKARERKSGNLDTSSTRQSRKTGSNLDGESGDSNLLRRPLSGIQNIPPSFMTRARKSRTEERLAKVLNWNQREVRIPLHLPPSQESRLGSDGKKKNGEVGRSSTLLRESVFSCGVARLLGSQNSTSSQASFSPSGLLLSDAGDYGVHTENDVLVSSPHASNKMPTSSEVSPSYEADGVQIFSANSSDKAKSSSEARPSPVEDNVSVAFEVTPARRASSRLATSALRTPEHLVPALGDGLSAKNGEAVTEGNLRVYGRRTSEQRGKKSNWSKTCPQLRGPSTSTSSGKGSQHYFFRRLKDFSTPERRAGSGRRKTSSSPSENKNMLLPESYREEKCAYFAEVDAFELLEEEADEEEEPEEPKKQPENVE